MKAIWIIIAVVALFLLAAVSLNTGRIFMQLGDSNQVCKELINSNLYVSNSNKLLSEEIVALRKQIIELSNKVPNK